MALGSPLRLLLLLAACACAAADPAVGPDLEGYQYPYPIQTFGLKSQSQSFGMAYMDVPAAGHSRHTVVLLHGAEFCGALWREIIPALHRAGARVIAIDQLGTCKSSKPVHYQYSFHQLAANTSQLLASLNVGSIVLVGHSFGGMLAMRYALMFPNQLQRLVLIDPLGLEDWKAEGAGYLPIDQRYALLIQTRAADIRRYDLENYLGGHWNPVLDPWVQMLAGMYQGTGSERFAWDQALIEDMIFTQPVIYELGRLRTPTLIIVGARDRAAPFRSTAPKDVGERMGDYPLLARRAAERMPAARVIVLEDVGHVPPLESPQRTAELLVQSLETPTAAASPPPAHRSQPD